MEIKKDRLWIAAGPCSINSCEDLLETAQAVKEAGADALRAGILKPRKNAKSYQGVGLQGIEYLAKAKEQTGLPLVVEARDVQSADEIASVCDVIQIGSRNMQNTELLRATAQAANKYGRKILLKRSFGANMDELLGALSYFAEESLPADKIMVCERGIRTFADGTYSRFTLDTNIIAYWRQTHPETIMIADVSHSAGERALVPQLALASLAAGAQGLLIEARLNPEDEQCDRKQTIDIPTLKRIIDLSGKAAEMYEAVTADK